MNLADRQKLLTFVCVVASPCLCFGQYGNSYQQVPHSSFRPQQYSQPVIQNGYSRSVVTRPAYSQPTYSQPAYGHSRSYSNQSRSSVYGGRQVTTYGNRSYSTQRRAYGNRSTQRNRGNDIQNLNNARPGQYYRWKTASGTSEKGYVAHDGSRWKLLKSSGIVEVDQWGNKRTISHQSSGHPYRYVWHIQKNTSAKKTAWIARSESTGAISVFYQRPRYSVKTRFYPATVVLEDNSRIVDLKWQTAPDWANDVRLVVASKLPRLPVGIHRHTSKKYLPASEYDVAVAQRAMPSANPMRQLTPQLVVPYETAPPPTLNVPSLSLPQPSPNYTVPGATVAR